MNPCTEKSALNYFGVDYDTFQRRINKVIRESLLNAFGDCSPQEIKDLQEVIGLQHIDLESYMTSDSDRLWDIGEIERLACPLEIGASDGLDPLEFSEVERSYWIDRMKRSHFVIGAPVELTSDEEIRRGKNPVDPLPFYLYLAALDEINAITAKRRKEPSA
jgi:hypothetical protein